ncbi:MAG TPA: DUF1259 domain-containing protein, partial [Pyrinomonadaceae bacterium]|nr:DUF1259 domain-containing protein [Pyrinomonadaceae bacterium]
MDKLTRREALGGILATAGILALSKVSPAASSNEPMSAIAEGKTPPLKPEEITAIETALGKKGKYVEAENVYTVPLPRNDLKLSIRGEAVPISFGFGGWVSVK